MRPRNGSCHGRDDLHGGLEARYVIARGCGGKTQSLSWAPQKVGPAQAVSVLDPVPKATKQDRGHDIALRKMGCSSAGEGTQVGNKLDECVSKRGRLFRFVFEDFSVPP